MGSKIRDEKLGCLTKKPMANDWLAPDYAGRKKDGVSRIKIACVGGCPKRQRAARDSGERFSEGCHLGGRTVKSPRNAPHGDGVWLGWAEWRCNGLWLLASGRDASRRAVCVVGGGGWW